MTAWADVVGAIRCSPEDDAPRRAAASWLERRGDARADFILRGRASPEELAGWRAPLETLGARSTVRDAALPFDRGFITTISLLGRSGDNFAAICALEPIVSLTLVSSGAGVFARLAERPELAQLRSLCITGNHRDGHEALVASPYLTQVRELRHPYDTLAKLDERPPEERERGRANLASAYAAAAAGGSLSLSRCDDDMLARVAAHPLTGLRALLLRECSAGARGYAAFAAHLDRLETIQFDLTPFTTADARELVQHMPSGRLRCVMQNGEHGSGLDTLVMSPAFRGVESLDVDYGYLPESSLRRTPYRTMLRHLTYGWGKPVGSPFRLDGVKVEVFDEGW